MKQIVLASALLLELDQLRDTMHRIKLSGGGAGMGTAR